MQQLPARATEALSTSKHHGILCGMPKMMLRGLVCSAVVCVSGSESGQEACALKISS